jgi:hypothetical protein
MKVAARHTAVETRGFTGVLARKEHEMTAITADRAVGASAVLEHVARAIADLAPASVVTPHGWDAQEDAPIISIDARHAEGAKLIRRLRDTYNVAARLLRSGSEWTESLLLIAPVELRLASPQATPEVFRVDVDLI